MKALYVSRRVEGKTINPTKSQKTEIKTKKQTQRGTPLKSKQLFTKSPFQNYTLPHSILLPPNSSHGLHGSCSLWMQATFLRPPDGYPLHLPQVSSFPGMFLSIWGWTLSEQRLCLFTSFVTTGITDLPLCQQCELKAHTTEKNKCITLVASWQKI